MVRPAHFGYNEQTAVSNTFQQKPGEHKDLGGLVLGEFDEAVASIRAKGIAVWVIEDRSNPICPDAVFPNNWISTHEDGTIVLYPMLTPNRRAERRADVVEQLKDWCVVSRVLDLSQYEQEERFLEGTGSIVFDHSAKTAYACLSPRTDKMILEVLCRELGYEPLTFRAVNEDGIEIYHTNVVMGIGPGYAVICLDAIRDQQEREQIVDTLNRSAKEIVAISQEQMNQFGGNVLALHNSSGQSFLALSESAYNSLTPEQIAIIKQYSELIPIAIPTIETIGGGSVRCMIAQNFLRFTS